MFMIDVNNVIDALGGTKLASKMLDVGPSAVSNYRKDNRFPDRLHHRVFLLCKENDIELPPEFFEPPQQSAA